MKSKVLNFAVILGLTLLASCKANKDYIYLQDVVIGEKYSYNHHEAVVHEGDKLSILVSCKNPELAIPFNSTMGMLQVQGDLNNINTTAQQRSAVYKVDNDGDIEYPILGMLHVAGLTQKQVQDLVKDKIVEGKYIANPIVTMEFLNFKYTMIGATGTGTYSVEDGTINLIEAIAKAGDLAGNANTKRVLVFREENGKRVMYEHDLTNSDFMASPCYYLQQNDIVYVEPKYKKSDFGDNALKYGSFLLSLVSATATVMWAIRSFK